MFKSIAEARKVLSATFDVTHVDMLIAALQPTIAFRPDLVGTLPALGATRIGGTPDLARDTAWPIRAVPANLEEIAARGGTAHRDHIEKHLRRALPFEFLAQVDLAEAARLGPVDSSLPSEGRLLFFNDGAIGPWHSGPEMCRVMWDRTPAGDLLHQPSPQGLIELSEDYIREAHEAARKDGWSQEELAPPYWGPARAMRLVHEFRLPHYSSIEARSNTSLAAALLDDDFASRYQGHFDAFWSKDSKASRHQLLGGPIPEQDDPRYDAVIVTEHGVQHLPRETWKIDAPRLRSLANEWRLLLQIDNQDYLQQPFVEGTIYFVIHRADLAARAFEKVVAVYQQT